MNGATGPGASARKRFERLNTLRTENQRYVNFQAYLTAECGWKTGMVIDVALLERAILAAEATIRDLAFAKPFGVRVSFKDSIVNEPPEMRLVLRGLGRHYTAGLIAPGGAGKSYLALQIAVAVATGGAYDEIGLVPEGAEPQRVLYLSAEEDQATLWLRLRAIAAHVPPDLWDLIDRNLVVISLLGHVPTLVDRNLKIDEKAVQHLIDLALGSAMVIIDPARKFHSADENKSGDVTALTQVFDRIAVDADTSVLFVHHAGKDATMNGGGSQAGAARGSSAITDNVRLQLNLTKLADESLAEYGLGPTDRPWYVALDVAKSNHAAPEDTRLLRRRSDGTLCRDEMTENARVIATAKRQMKRPQPVRLAEESESRTGLPTLEEYIRGL